MTTNAPPNPMEILRQLQALPLADRESLLADFMDRLDEESDEVWEYVETADNWDEEIERRLEELNSGAVRGIPMEEAMRMICDESD